MMEDVRIAIGERLREAREKSGLKQNMVAKHLGIHNSTLAKYESGTREADNETLIKLAELYQVNVEWLLKGVGPRLRASDYIDVANKMKETDGIKEQTATNYTTNRSYSGGGLDWTEEEIAMADEIIKAIRARGSKLNKPKE